MHGEIEKRRFFLSLFKTVESSRRRRHGATEARGRELSIAGWHGLDLWRGKKALKAKPFYLIPTAIGDR